MKAVAYFRTSSITNVGHDKDSEKRQRDSVSSFAASSGYEIVHEFYDAAVKGKDAITDRPEFTKMLEWMEANGVTVILVENAGRFARDLIVQLTGHDLLKGMGFVLIPADAPDYFTEDTPTAVLIRQLLGAVAEFEKSGLVERLRKARERVRRETGRCGGRPPVPADVVAVARQLRSEGRSYGSIGNMLLKVAGKRYGAESVKKMCVK